MTSSLYYGRSSLSSLSSLSCTSPSASCSSPTDSDTMWQQAPTATAAGAVQGMMSSCWLRTMTHTSPPRSRHPQVRALWPTEGWEEHTAHRWQAGVSCFVSLRAHLRHHASHHCLQRELPSGPSTLLHTLSCCLQRRPTAHTAGGHHYLRHKLPPGLSEVLPRPSCCLQRHPIADSSHEQCCCLQHRLTTCPAGLTCIASYILLCPLCQEW